MISCRILLIEGHPDPIGKHFCHALADSYADGAEQEGHVVRRVHVSQLDFPLLRSQQDWELGELPDTLKQAQEDIAWAQHLVLFFPMWLGDMPALLKGFLEQIARPGFAFKTDGKNLMGKKALTGRSARLVITIGMPALLYRWYFRAHSVKSLERNVLGFVGISPVSETLIGMVDKLTPKHAQKWLDKMRKLGAACE